MNLFKKLFSKIKETIDETIRERELKASHKSYVAGLEEEIIKLENKLNSKVTNSNYTFKDIVNVYEEIELKKDEIKLANETYDYIFKETNSK